MFTRAGGSIPKRTIEGVLEALTFVADRIWRLVQVQSSKPGTPLWTSSSTGAGSPAELIGKCYKQLAELNHLRSLGVLNESDYHMEES